MTQEFRHDIYIIGVGGQGIGLFSETLMRAADYAGYPVRGVDTHGLAQRGGTVSSHVRIGAGTYSPLVREGCADMVVALEKYEALRGMETYLRHGGTLVYYDTMLQPLQVRLGKEPILRDEELAAECQRRGVHFLAVRPEFSVDARMQNILLLGEIIKESLLGKIGPSHVELALRDLLSGTMLEKNLEIFHQWAGEKL